MLAWGISTLQLLDAGTLGLLGEVGQQLVIIEGIPPSLPKPACQRLGIVTMGICVYLCIRSLDN